MQDDTPIAKHKSPLFSATKMHALSHTHCIYWPCIPHRRSSTIPCLFYFRICSSVWGKGGCCAERSVSCTSPPRNEIVSLDGGACSRHPSPPQRKKRAATTPRKVLRRFVFIPVNGPRPLPPSHTLTYIPQAVGDPLCLLNNLPPFPSPHSHPEFVSIGSIILLYFRYLPPRCFQLSECSHALFLLFLNRAVFVFYHSNRLPGQMGRARFKNYRHRVQGLTSFIPSLFI
jgi:hypothetical protein